jgi:hypothetical protein
MVGIPVSGEEEDYKRNFLSKKIYAKTEIIPSELAPPT